MLDTIYRKLPKSKSVAFKVAIHTHTE